MDNSLTTMIKEFAKDVIVPCQGNNVCITSLTSSFLSWFHMKYEEGKIDYFLAENSINNVISNITNGFVTNIDLVYPFSLFLLTSEEIIKVFLLNKTKKCIGSKISIDTLFDNYIGWIRKIFPTKATPTGIRKTDFIYHIMCMIELNKEKNYVLDIQLEENPKDVIDMGMNKKAHEHLNDVFSFVNEMIIDNTIEMDLIALYDMYVEWCKRKNIQCIDQHYSHIFSETVLMMLKNFIVFTGEKFYYMKTDKIISC